MQQRQFYDVELLCLGQSRASLASDTEHRGPKVRVHRSGNTFSTKMLLFGSVLLVTGLICNIEAVGPTVSNNEWTPVVNSQRVYLSPEVLAKYRQEELQGTQANER